MDTRPVVSIVIPVYNAEHFLRECLDGLIRQTLDDFEVLCIDDGSSDQSLEILQNYAERDQRFTVLRQDHAYAGIARNLGISSSSGRYMLFLDADDRFIPCMLETAVRNAEEAEAEICVFGAEIFDSETGKVSPLSFACNPSVKQKGVFSWRDDPDRIFRFTNTAPWNKLIKRDFIEKEALQFSNLPNSNDLSFVWTAIAAASRIITVLHPLVQYRDNRPTSLQGSIETAPLAFYDALLELQKNLKGKNIYDILERPFINQAAAVILYNLLAAKTDEAFEQIYDFLRNTGLDSLKLSDRSNDYFYPVPHENYHKMVRLIQEGSIRDFAAEFQTSAPGYRPLKRKKLRDHIRSLIRSLLR